MKIMGSLALFTLAACTAPTGDDKSSQSQPPEKEAIAPSPQAQPAEKAKPTLSKECDAQTVQSAVGKTFTDKLGVELQAKAGAKALRAIPPSHSKTDDLRIDRLTIDLDDKMVITEISCV